MKEVHAPRWLYFDFLALIGVGLSFCAFTSYFARLGERMWAERRWCTRTEWDRLGDLLTTAEAWLDFAILRRAFRLAGLRASEVRFVMPSLPRTDWAPSHRGFAYANRFLAMDRLARRFAARIKRLRAAAAAAATTRTAATTTSTTAAKLCVVMAVVPASPVLPTARRAGMRVRAPPWRSPARCRLPTASKRQLPRTRAHARLQPQLLRKDLVHRRRVGLAA